MASLLFQEGGLLCCAHPSLSLEALRNASRVVGGGDAGFGRFPWMALVRGTHTRYVSPICDTSSFLESSCSCLHFLGVGEL